jgi:hypothetical protein
VHLEAKDPTEMTGIESYVHRMYQNGDHAWLPRQNALCLQVNEHEDDKEESDMKKIKDELKNYCAKLDEFQEKITVLTNIAIKKKKE